MALITGQMVLISGDLEKTKIHYGLNEEMIRMKGGLFPINAVITKQHIIIGKYNWHSADLTPVDNQEDAPVYDIKNFDPANLVL